MEQEEIKILDALCAIAVYERKDKDALIEELRLINDFLSSQGPKVDWSRKRKSQLNKILEQWLEEDAAEAAGK